MEETNDYRAGENADEKRKYDEISRQHQAIHSVIKKVGFPLAASLLILCGCDVVGTIRTFERNPFYNQGEAIERRIEDAKRSLLKIDSSKGNLESAVSESQAEIKRLEENQDYRDFNEWNKINVHPSGKRSFYEYLAGIGAIILTFSGMLINYNIRDRRLRRYGSCEAETKENVETTPLLEADEPINKPIEINLDETHDALVGK